MNDQQEPDQKQQPIGCLDALMWIAIVVSIVMSIVATVRMWFV